MRRGARFLGLGFAFAAFSWSTASAATLQTVGSFTDPVYVTSEPSDPGALLVVEQRGVIERAKNGVVSPYLDIHDMVATGGERGLLSVALSPDYATSGLLYVYYTSTAGSGDLQIDEFRAVGDSVSPATRRPLLTIAHDDNASNHNGGQLQFGPDGFLYFATGDGAVSPGSAQDVNSLLGKLLRISPRPGSGLAYTVPATNPYVGLPGADEIWSIGLRNPWRFSFDRSTGDLVIADVGQSAFEEVDFQLAPDAGRGANFGWNRCEGPVTTGTSNPCDLAGATPPVLTYPHGGGTCAITGGYIVRDQSLGDLYGRYLFADLCTGQVSSVRLGLPAATGLRTEPFTAAQPSSFGEDSCGRVYLASLGSDRVYRLVDNAPANCSSSGQGPATRCGGKPVTRAASPAGGRLEGTSGKDVIAGSDAEDRIFGHGGGDIICGGDGDDVLKGGAGEDDLRGGAGGDELRGNGGKDSCKGGSGQDQVKSC